MIKTTRKTTGVTLAMAAATMLAIAPISAHAGSTDGHCVGVNACKGHSSCKTATNSCKGLNSCKGKGFVVMSKSACSDIGGDFEA